MSVDPSAPDLKIRQLAGYLTEPLPLRLSHRLQAPALALERFLIEAMTVLSQISKVELLDFAVLQPAARCGARLTVERTEVVAPVGTNEDADLLRAFIEIGGKAEPRRRPP